MTPSTKRPLSARLGLAGSPQGSLLRAYQSIRGQLFSRFIASGFSAFGSTSVIRPPLRVYGERHIAIGSGVFIGGDSWLQASDDHGSGLKITIGDRTSIVGAAVISSVVQVTIGTEVLIARNSYIADHSHATSDRTRSVLTQGITGIEPVTIGDGSWLGQNVVILPGTTLGRHCVVGANSVVRGNFPDGAVIVGAPAKLIRVIE